MFLIEQELLSLKDQGNKALQEGDIDKAIELYSEGINLDEENYLLWSNRALCYAKKGMWKESLDDANKLTFLKPDWPKV